MKKEKITDNLGDKGLDFSLVGGKPKKAKSIVLFVIFGIAVVLFLVFRFPKIITNSTDENNVRKSSVAISKFESFKFEHCIIVVDKSGNASVSFDVIDGKRILSKRYFTNDTLIFRNINNGERFAEVVSNDKETWHVFISADQWWRMEKLYLP